MSAKQHKF